MIWLFIHRFVIFVVSAVSYGVGLWGVLWCVQIMAINNALISQDMMLDRAEIGVIAIGLQLFVFLLIVSPLGSLFQRAYLPVRRMSKREAEMLEPLLEAVMSGYHENKVERIKRVRLKIEDDPDPNAYAYGRNCVALTSGLYEQYRSQPEVIKGVLAHELGHLHHRDIWFAHYVMATGGVLTLIYAILRFSADLSMKIADILIPVLVVAIPLMIAQYLMGMIILVLRIPEIFLNKLSIFLSQTQEYRADKFAADVIGVKGMITFLEAVKKDEKFSEVGFLSMRRRSHPPSELRLEQFYEHPDYKEMIKNKNTKKRQLGNEEKIFSKSLHLPYSEEKNLTPYI